MGIDPYYGFYGGQSKPAPNTSTTSAQVTSDAPSLQVLAQAQAAEQAKAAPGEVVALHTSASGVVSREIIRTSSDPLYYTSPTKSAELYNPSYKPPSGQQANTSTVGGPRYSPAPDLAKPIQTTYNLKEPESRFMQISRAIAQSPEGIGGYSYYYGLRGTREGQPISYGVGGVGNVYADRALLEQQNAIRNRQILSDLSTDNYKIYPNPNPTPDKRTFYTTPKNTTDLSSYFKYYERVEGLGLAEAGSKLGGNIGGMVGGLGDIIAQSGKTFSQGKGDLGFHPEYIGKTAFQIGAAVPITAGTALLLVREKSSLPFSMTGSKEETLKGFESQKKGAEFLISLEVSGRTIGYFSKAADVGGLRYTEYQGERYLGFKIGEKIVSFKEPPSYSYGKVTSSGIEIGQTYALRERPIEQGKSPFQTYIFEKVITSKISAPEMASYNIGKTLMKGTEGTKSELIGAKFKLEIERLTPEGNLALETYIRSKPGTRVFGSVAQKAQSGKFMTRVPQDVDIQTANVEGFALGAKDVLTLAGEKDLRVTPTKTGYLVEKYYAESGGYGHIVDIHPPTEGVGGGSYLFPDQSLGLGFKQQKPVTIDSIRFMRLSEQSIRKGVSIFKPRSESELRSYLEKGLKLKEHEFAPEPHRIKDVGDFLTTQKALIASQRLKTAAYLPAIGEAIRLRIAAREYGLEQLTQYFGKKYGTDVIGNRELIYSSPVISSKTPTPYALGSYYRAGKTTNSYYLSNKSQAYLSLNGDQYSNLYSNLSSKNSYSPAGAYNPSTIPYTTNYSSTKYSPGASYLLSSIQAPSSPSRSPPSPSSLIPSFSPSRISSPSRSPPSPSSLIPSFSPSRISSPSPSPTPYTNIGGKFWFLDKPNNFVQKSKSKAIDTFKRFTLFVRRKGVYRPAGTFGTKEFAITRGKGIVESTLAATFKVRGSPGEKIGFFSPKFYTKQEKGEEVYIQKRGFRLSTLGEVAEIRRAKLFGGIRL